MKGHPRKNQRRFQFSNNEDLNAAEESFEKYTQLFDFNAGYRILADRIMHVNGNLGWTPENAIEITNFK